MQFDCGGDVDASDTISVGQQEGVVVLEIFPDAMNAFAGHRISAGIGERDLPILLGVTGMKFGLWLLAEEERRVANIPEIIPEVLLNHLTFVAEAEDELFETVMRIRFHDVPENRPVADRQHWFRAKLRFFTESRALTATEDNYFHRAIKGEMVLRSV